MSCRPFDNLLLLSDFLGSGFFSTFSVGDRVRVRFKVRVSVRIMVIVRVR